MTKSSISSRFPTKAQFAFQLLKHTWEEFSNDNCFRMAAALSYYTLFSMPPLLVITIALCGHLFDPQDVKGHVAGEIEMLVGKQGADQVRTMIDQADEPGHGLWATIIGTTVLLFGASGAVAQLQESFNDIWNVKPSPTRNALIYMALKRLISIAMVMGVAFLLLVSLLATAALNALSSWIIPEAYSTGVLRWVHFLVTVLLLTTMFAAMFKTLPDVRVAWKDVWVGAGVTSLLFVIGKFALGYYLGNSEIGNVYGAAGSMALVLAWVYYSALILFLGGEFTQVWARMHGRRGKPATGAVRVIQQTVQTERGPDSQ